MRLRCCGATLAYLTNVVSRPLSIIGSRPAEADPGTSPRLGRERSPGLGFGVAERTSKRRPGGREGGSHRAADSPPNRQLPKSTRAMRTLPTLRSRSQKGLMMGVL